MDSEDTARAELMIEVRDKIGQEIQPGSYIAYGHALGRCAGLRIGRVLKVEAWEEEPWRGSDKWVAVYRIQVQGVDNESSYQEPRLTSKKGTLQFPDRIIVLDKAKVSSAYLDLLEGVE